MNCPSCKHQLVKKYEGLACKNWNCILYSKLGKGWFYISPDQTYDVPEKLNFVDRKYYNKEWIYLKQSILRRDNYTCCICNEKQLNALNPMQVHHIIRDADNKALSYDEDNLISVCKSCHATLHEKDKHSWFRGHK